MSETQRQMTWDEVVAQMVVYRNERDALKADAARYRWLRRGQKWSVIDGIGDALRAEVLDAAIDAAIAKESKT